MSEETTVEPTKVSLSFEVKIGLPNYSNVVARAFVERRVTEGLTEEGELSVAFSLAQAAVDEALADFGGIEAVVPQVVGTGRGGKEVSVEALAQSFGATIEDEEPAPRSVAPTSSGLQVAGKQHGPLPEWLIEAAAAAGVTKVFDNRDGLAENAKRPWFKDANGGKDGKAFWPPKGYKAA